MKGSLKTTSGYHFGVLCCAITAGVVLLVNLILTIWAAETFGVHNGLGIVQVGSCNKTKRLSLWLHLLINALSTLLLGASNYSMQCI